MQLETMRVYNKKGNEEVINKKDFDKNKHSKNKPKSSQSTKSKSKTPKSSS